MVHRQKEKKSKNFRNPKPKRKSTIIIELNLLSKCIDILIFLQEYF